MFNIVYVRASKEEMVARVEEYIKDWNLKKTVDDKTIHDWITAWEDGYTARDLAKGLIEYGYLEEVA